VGILPEANHVGENAVCAGHTLGHLAIESVGVIDVNALAVFRKNESALLRSLARIVGLQERLIR
jgi:hypothetical protein